MHVVKWLTKCVVFDVVVLLVLQFLFGGIFSELEGILRIIANFAIIFIGIALIIINIIMGFSNCIGQPDAIVLSYKRFKDLYSINPKAYRLTNCNIFRRYTEDDEKEGIKPKYFIMHEYDYTATPYVAIIRLNSWIEYIKYYIDRYINNKNQSNMDKNEKYKNYLEACEIDIERIRKQAEENLNKARKETERIGLSFNDYNNLNIYNKERKNQQ